MKYYLPDSQDHVDPSFDFETEKRDVMRRRQRDDLYAHEVLRERSYDGLLVSKGIVDGFGETGSRYTLAHRHRLMRSGAKEFFRLESCPWGPLPVMGDCGAFTYVREDKPPYRVDDVISFYLECGFDQGISVDHIILDYKPDWEENDSAPQAIRQRQEITFELADEFLRRCRSEKVPFEPLGVAQGWGPRSYAHAVETLQKMGFTYIAIGGMVPLKTKDILTSLEQIAEVRQPKTKFHLLGVTRTEELKSFERFGVASFDSTSPLRQAFKDDKDNYYTPEGAFPAIRIPQVEGNATLMKLISSGKRSQEQARRMELSCLEGMRLFDRGELGVDEMVDRLAEYEQLCLDPDKKGRRTTDHSEVYRQVLTERPWKHCTCEVCKALGYHVILFRGAERNRRRGFHNIHVFYRRLQAQKAASKAEARPASAKPRRATRSHEERASNSRD